MWVRSDTTFIFPDTTFHISRCHLLYRYGKGYRGLAGDQIIKQHRSDTAFNFSHCGLDQILQLILLKWLQPDSTFNLK